ncbi:hypothetical protein GGF42_006684, partial [Coemansia sp. RSA 2424]
MPLVPPPSSTRKKPRCMVPAAAVEPDHHHHHQSATAQRRSLSRRAVSVEVSEQPTAHRSTRSRTQPRLQKQEEDEEKQQLATETRPRRTSYDGGCVRRQRLRRRTSEEDERGEDAQEREEEEDEDEEDANPYARKRYRSVRSAVAQAYPRRRSRRPAAPPENDEAAVEKEEKEEEEEGVPAAGKWRRHDQQQLLDVAMDGSEPLVDGGDIDGDLGAVLLLDSIFGNESPTVAASSAKDDLAAVVAADLLAPGIDDSVVPLTCSATSAGEQLDSPASPASLLLHNNNNRHTTTPADLSPRLLSISTGSSVATTAVDYDFSFHDLMDAELMSVNELENLWATSNPADEHAAVSPSPPPPPPITPSLPLATIRETSDSDDAATTATAAAAAGDALPSRLTQRLLALSATTTSLSSQQLAKPAPLSLLSLSSAPPSLASACSALVDSVEPTAALVENTSEHTSEHKELVESAPDDDDDGEESALEHKEKEAAEGGGSKVILPDPFGDIAASAMVATKVAVSPRVVLTIVETVPVYMTVVTTTEPAGAQQGKWLVRRHRLLRLVENGYVNASSLLLAGGVASEQERSIVLSLEVGRFKWRRPQSKLYGTWIPLPRARALAATCSLNHRLGPFLNDNLEAYFPAPLPTSFVRHVITPFFEEQQQQSKAEEFQSLVSAVSAHHNHNLHPPQAISRSSTFGATARGTPSPSIIQALSRAPSLSAAAAAAKAIFASDDRHLQSLLQLLSADGPMLVPGSTTSGSEPVSEDVAGSVPAVSESAAPESESEAAAPPLLGDGDGSGGGGVDAARLSDAIASTLAQEEEGEKEEEEEEEEKGGIAEHDMICSSTPPSPPPPPAQESKRKMPLRSVASARGAAGLNARLAQTMEAFGLTGAAKASMLLRLRAAAAATSTGHPLAVAPYLLYNTTTKHRRVEDLADGRTRKRARVMRVARCKPGTEPPSAEAAAPAPAAHPKRLVDAAAIL